MKDLTLRFFLLGISLCALTALALSDYSARAAPGHGNPEGSDFELSAAMRQLGQRINATWYAAQAGNAALVDYELREIAEVIEDVEKGRPMEGEVDVAAMIKTLLPVRLEALKTTVEAGNAEAFRAAYQETLDACNSCHTLTKHPFIRVVTPTSPSVGNLDWAAGVKD